MNKPKYTLKDTGGPVFLLINGIPAVCPFRSPNLIANKIAGGQPDIIQPQCNSLCPFFEIEEMGVKLNCVSNGRYIKAE